MKGNTGISNKEQGTDEQGRRIQEYRTRNRRTRNFEVSKNDKCGNDYRHSKFFFYFLARLFLVPCSSVPSCLHQLLISIQVGAWSLLFSHPRTCLSTPAADNFLLSAGLNRK